MLTRISVTGFRNLADQAWEPGPGSHLLIGANGAGKTSLLEAVYLLATTRSFRTARLADCRRHGDRSFDLSGRVEAERRTDLEVGWGTDGKRRSVNGGESSLAEHLRVLPVASWTSADAEVVGGSPSARRRFLDQGLVATSPAALDVLARYRRVLDQKRRLLAERGPGLASWNELQATAAAELVAARDRFVGRLRRQLATLLEAAGERLPAIEVDYRPSPADGRQGAEAILERLERVRSREIEARAPLVGPQRDEMVVSWGGHEARRTASAGERKLVGLALVAARGRLRADGVQSPIFLLDDLGAELDAGRLATAWRLFADAPQIVAATSREDLAAALAPDHLWRVAEGRLEALQPRSRDES